MVYGVREVNTAVFVDHLVVAPATRPRIQQAQRAEADSIFSDMCVLACLAFAAVGNFPGSMREVRPEMTHLRFGSREINNVDENHLSNWRINQNAESVHDVIVETHPTVLGTLRDVRHPVIAAHCRCSRC